MLVNKKTGCQISQNEQRPLYLVGGWFRFQSELDMAPLQVLPPHAHTPAMACLNQVSMHRVYQILVPWGGGPVPLTLIPVQSSYHTSGVLGRGHSMCEGHGGPRW